MNTDDMSDTSDMSSRCSSHSNAAFLSVSTMVRIVFKAEGSFPSRLHFEARPVDILWKNGMDWIDVNQPSTFPV